jgi:hypothetical protein
MRGAARGVETFFVAVGAAVVALGVLLLGWSLPGWLKSILGGRSRP